MTVEDENEHFFAHLQHINEALFFFFFYSDFSSFEHLPELLTPSDSTSESSTTSDEPQTPIDAIRQMTCSSAFRNEFTYMTVLDVYDEATAIGHDFERIIEGERCSVHLGGGLHRSS